MSPNSFKNKLAFFSLEGDRKEGKVNERKKRINFLSFTLIDFFQVSVLRQHTTLPLIFTVRTIGQGGKFPEEENMILPCSSFLFSFP